jgi:hypothetical protein
VRTEVKKETDGKQSPWYEASIDGDFYFSNGTEGKPRKPTDVEMSAVDFIGLYYNTIKKAPYSRTWAMLADSFREKTGFSSYIDWWDKKVDEVWIEKVKQLSPNKVQATLLYRMKTGKTICSIDTFTLRQDSGAWLIHDQVYKNCAQ